MNGYNISLVTQSVQLVARRAFARWTALVFSLVAILLYAAFVGPTAPVVRAALMGGLFTLGVLVGRPSHALTTLVAASFLMLLVNPLLLWSASFQLSFAATLALIVVAPWLTRVLGAKRAARSQQPSAESRLATGLRDTAITTTAAQLLTLPVMWYHFGELSLVALPANVLVLPVQPIVMLLGVLATALGSIWRPLGQASGWLVWPFLRYTNGVVQGLGALPWAAVALPKISLGMGLTVVCLAAAIWFAGGARRVRNRLLAWARLPAMHRTALVGLALVVALLIAAQVGLPDGRLHVYFLDVGQGDATLLRTPAGRYLLVDGGPDPVLLTSRLGQVMPFWQRTLDVVIATHPDSDHSTGLYSVLQRYKVQHVIQAPSLSGDAHWMESVQRSKANVTWATRGTVASIGSGLQLEVLHPPPGAGRSVASDANRDSVVLRITAGHTRLLLAADINSASEDEMLTAGMDVAANLLKVAHHGADSATEERFLAAVNPQLAVISVGAKNRFGHPSDRVLGRLQERDCAILRTDVQGTIEFITDGDRCWVKTERPRR